VLQKHLVLMVGVLTLSACAHHRAVRVECEGPLRPINPPAAAPLKKDTMPRSEVAPPATDSSEVGHGR
jgi:hypothetical protein